MMTNTGKNIRSLRKKAGLTQKELAKKAGINEVTVRSYEAGKYAPKIETLKKLATALNCEVSDIDETIAVISLPGYELTPERLERIKRNAEAQELIERMASGEELTELERQAISDYVARQKDAVDRFGDIAGKVSKAADDYGKTLLLSKYEKLNADGQGEALKRITELTELPRYTKPDKPPRE